MIERMKRLDRKLMYQGSILDVYKDTMEFPNGTHEEWDFVSHRMGAAAILPVLPDGRIVMVRQYRNALERETLEIPAGRDILAQAHSCRSRTWRRICRCCLYLKGAE